MNYKVYDDAKILLAQFETEAEANRYIYNNDDIAAFLNDERVVEIKHIPVAPAPTQASTVQTKTKKLITAEEAKMEIKKRQADEIDFMVNTVIEQGGLAAFTNVHPLIKEQLIELGYVVEEENGTLSVSI